MDASSVPRDAAAYKEDFFIPASDFTDPEITRREREKLWPKVWQIACREEEIPKVGDYVRYDILDESILVVRTAKDKISAFYNACQHRGRQLVDEPRGSVGQGFYCKFHGWKYKLDGTLARVHVKEAWGDCGAFTDGSLNLKQPLADTWAGWVWINMDPDAEPLLDYLGEAADVFRPFEIEKMRFAWYSTLIMPTNWKVALEGFNEGHHVATTHTTGFDYHGLHNYGSVHGKHASFNASFTPCRVKDHETGEWRMETGPADRGFHSQRVLHTEFHAPAGGGQIRAYSRLLEEFPGEASPEEIGAKYLQYYREEVEATGAEWPKDLDGAALQRGGADWHIFPNTVFLPTADLIIWYRFRPDPADEHNSCLFDIWCLCRYPPGGEPKVEQVFSPSLEAFKGRNVFLEQDFSNLGAVSRGVKSRGFAGAFANPDEETSVIHFHKVLHSYID
jgi:phenylpropionate dioxygenase-like ring-hydroxylating dioxygenase large terminal subunit